MRLFTPCRSLASMEALGSFHDFIETRGELISFRPSFCPRCPCWLRMPTYSAMWVGTTNEMPGLFLRAFGVEIISEAVINAFRKIAPRGVERIWAGDLRRCGFPRGGCSSPRSQSTVRLCTKAENHLKTLVLFRDGGFLVENWALDFRASIRRGSESLFQ